MRLTSLIPALALAATFVLGASAHAQSMTFPTLDFPEPGTFCGPFQVCAPDVATRGN